MTEKAPKTPRSERWAQLTALITKRHKKAARAKPKAAPEPSPQVYPAETVLQMQDQGPTAIAAWDKPNLIEWLGIRSYAVRPGTGAFITFQVPSKADGLVIVDGVLLNGGLCDDGTITGKKQGCLDMITWIDDKLGYVSLVGNLPGQDAAFCNGEGAPVPLGSKQYPWPELWLAPVAVPAKYKSLPGSPKAAVRINGKLALLYDP